MSTRSAQQLWMYAFRSRSSCSVGSLVKPLSTALSAWMCRPAMARPISLPRFFSLSAFLTTSGWVAASGMTLGTPRRSGTTRKQTCSTWLEISSPMRSSLRRSTVCSEGCTPSAASIAWSEARWWPQEQMPQMRQVRSAASS